MDAQHFQLCIGPRLDFLPRVFTQLRTEQQLGYVVGSSYLPLQQQPHLLLYVQSNSHNHQQLEQRIKAFLNDFSEQLVTLLPQQLGATKQSILQQLREPDTNLRIRSQRLWTSIMQDDWQFNRLAALASAIEHWQADNLLEFWQHWQQSELSQCFVHAVPNHSSS